MKPTRSRRLFGMRFRSVKDSWAIDAFGWPPVFVRWDAAVFPVLMTYPLWSQLTASGLIAAAIVALALLLSILAHELGHALAARWRGHEALRIDIHGTGGLATYGGEDITARDERLITFAGPAVNIAIGAALLGCYGALTTLVFHASDAAGPWLTAPPAIIPVYVQALQWIGAFNIVLGVANLLPAYPLDGGKLAGQFLEARWGRDVTLFWIGVSGVALAAVSVLATFAFLLAGAFVRIPPTFSPNLDAIEASKWRPWRRPAAEPPPIRTAADVPDWLSQLSAKRETKTGRVLPLKKRRTPPS